MFIALDRMEKQLSSARSGMGFIRDNQRRSAQAPQVQMVSVLQRDSLPASDPPHAAPSGANPINWSAPSYKHGAPSGAKLLFWIASNYSLSQMPSTGKTSSRTLSKSLSNRPNFDKVCDKVVRQRRANRDFGTGPNFKPDAPNGALPRRRTDQMGLISRRLDRWSSAVVYVASKGPKGLARPTTCRRALAGFVFLITLLFRCSPLVAQPDSIPTHVLP
jgi:hypothetical protein